MNDIFDTFTYFNNYLDSIVKTAQAEDLMRTEVKTKTFQRDRWVLLSDLIVKEWEALQYNYPTIITVITTSISKGLSIKDHISQESYRKEIFKVIDEFAINFNSAHQLGFFTNTSLGWKKQTILEFTNEGSPVEKEIEKEYTLEMIAGDLNKKINQIQLLVKDRFDFILDKSSLEPSDTLKSTVASYALLHIFWKNIDPTKSITNTNKDKWGVIYNCSPNTLQNAFKKYYDRDQRKPGSRDIKSIIPFINTFKAAVELIKKHCKEALPAAQDELKVLVNRYEDELKEKNMYPL